MILYIFKHHYYTSTVFLAKTGTRGTWIKSSPQWIQLCLESSSLTFSVTGVNMSFSFLCWSQFDWISITYNQKTLKKHSCKEQVQDDMKCLIHGCGDLWRLSGSDWAEAGREAGDPIWLTHDCPPGPSVKQILSPVRGTTRRVSCEIVGFSSPRGWVTAAVILHNEPLTTHPPSRVALALPRDCTECWGPPFREPCARPPPAPAQPSCAVLTVTAEGQGASATS